MTSKCKDSDKNPKLFTQTCKIIQITMFYRRNITVCRILPGDYVLSAARPLSAIIPALLASQTCTLYIPAWPH